MQRLGLANTTFGFGTNATFKFWEGVNLMFGFANLMFGFESVM